MQKTKPLYKRLGAWVSAQSSGGNLVSSLLKGAGASSGLQMITLGLNFVMQIALARVMGADQFGIYMYVLAWFNVLLLVSKMGWDNTLTRYISAYRAQQKGGLMAGLLSISQRYGLAFSFACSAVAMAIVWGFRLSISSELFYTFCISFWMLPIWTLAALRDSTLNGMKHIALEKTAYLVHIAALIAIAGVAFGILRRPLRSSETMGLRLLASVVMLGVSQYWFTRKVTPYIKRQQPEYRSREWVKVALPLLLTSGIYMLLNQMDIIMIGSLSGTTEAGIYSVASRISLLLVLGLTSASAIAAPTISELYAQRQWPQLQKTVDVTLWIALGFAVPILLVIMVGGSLLLGVFGPNFGIGLIALQILAATQFFNVVTGPSGFLMTMTNYHNQYVAILGGALLVNGFLNYSLIPTYGMTGAAIATSVSNVVMNLVVVGFVYRQLGVKSFVTPGSFVTLVRRLRGRS